MPAAFNKLSGFFTTRKGGRISLNSFNGNKLKPYVHLNETIIPYLEFSIEFQSNQLIYQKEYTKRQQIIYLLIYHLYHREGWGYQKISNWLNKSSILTHTGKKWFSSSVISVLKRKHDRPKDSKNKRPTFP